MQEKLIKVTVRIMKTIGNDLQLCERCENGGSYMYDFNRRCCRARHTLTLNKTMREQKYERLQESHGDAAARQLIQDVKDLYLYRLSHGMVG